MFQVGRVIRLRQWLATALAAAVLASLMVVGGAVGAPSAGAALGIGDCRDAGIFPTQAIPETHGDGGPNNSGPLYTTAWNKPLAVASPGVLQNDGYTQDEPGGIKFLPKPERFRAILWTQPVDATVNLNTDGSFVFTPKMANAGADVVSTFQYLAYDASSFLCSDPTTVTVKISGFADGVPGAPVAGEDSFPTAGTTVSASGVVSVPEPGVLVDDWNAISDRVGSNLEAQLVTQPVWEGTTMPAGTITDWGQHRDEGGLVVQTPGSFTFTPVTGYGTAVFTYKACYTPDFIQEHGVVFTTCSAPVSVRINVPKPDPLVAWPFSKDLDEKGKARITYDDLRSHVMFDPAVTGLQPEFGAATVGYISNSISNNGKFQSADYFGYSFPSHAEIPYRMCGHTPEPTSPLTCTQWGTITIVGPPSTPPPSPAPVVASTSMPGKDNFAEVRFDSDVKGVDATSVTLIDVSSGSTAVPGELRCRWAPLFETFSNCVNGPVDRLFFIPTATLTVGHTYKFRINTPDTGVVGVGGTNTPLTPYEETFVFTRPDVDAPTAAPTATAPEGTWTNHDVTVAWNWSDGAGSGIDPASCTTTTASSGEGVQTLTASCSDVAGNTGTASYVVKVDTTRPVLYVVVSPPMPKQGWYTTDVSVVWNWSDDGSGIDPGKCDTAPTNDNREGLLLVASGCTDRAGNFALGGTSYDIDKTAPTASPVLSATGWSNQDVTVTWNWSDAGSGIDPTKCPATSTFTAEGSSGGTESCTDFAGNEGSSPGIIAFIDKTAPTAAPTTSATGWSKNDVTVTWHWADSGSGLDPTKCPATTTSTGDGAITVKASCTDLAGNVKNATADVQVDKTAPTASPVLSPSGWSKTNVTVTWRWTDGAGSGLDATKCPATSVVSAEGTTSPTVTCTDLVGNIGTSPPVSARIDKTAPTALPTTSVPAGTWSREDVTVTWHWSDGAGSGVDPAKCPATSVVSTEGISVAVVACTDLAGNLRISPLVPVRVDKTAPTAAPTASATGWSQRDVRVAWRWSDGGSGIDPARCPATTMSTGEGVLTVSARCTDRAGNTKTASVQVKVDKTAPALAPTVSPNPLLQGGVAIAAANATDVGGSGVSSSSCGKPDTTTIGAKVVQCTATDVAGNRRTASATYVVGVGMVWSNKPTTVKAKSGSTLSASVQLLGANGKPIPSTLAKSFPSCTVRFQLGTQSALCAVWMSGTATFGLTMKSTANLNVGTTVPFVATVRAGTVTVGTLTTDVAVAR